MKKSNIEVLKRKERMPKMILSALFRAFVLGIMFYLIKTEIQSIVLNYIVTFFGLLFIVESFMKSDDDYAEVIDKRHKVRNHYIHDDGDSKYTSKDGGIYPVFNNDADDNNFYFD